MPKGTTEVKEKLKEALEGLEDTYMIESITISDYNVMVTVNSLSTEYPTKYVRNLIEQDYFEAITFTGFTGEKPEVEEEENAEGAVAPSRNNEEEEVIYAFSLTMRLKGGNNVELK